MSSKAKKRKVSMEPVLQDFTVTSFSDLHPDGAGPSDSSLFEEIKNYDVELPEITFNQTADMNVLSGQYPSDSSLDSLIKPQSNSKLYSETQRPFRKRSNKKLVEENLFDSCLKDSFSDHSLKNVHKPFQRKPKHKVRLSMFDSDLESNTPVKDSPFKKPFQRKYKNKRQSNLFDSLIKDSQSNTPDEQLSRRPFQRKPKKKINSDSFDKVFSNDSINQPSPVQNFITRRRNRLKKLDCSNLFDDDLASSQSDVSIPLQPLSLKLKTGSNHIKNDTGMFDDLLNATGNESHNENSSVLDPCNKHDYLNEGNTKSFSLEYNEETGGSTKDDDFSKEEEKMEPDTEDGWTDEHKENNKENKFIAELPDQQNTSTGDECLQLQETFDNDKSVVHSPKQREFLEYEKEKEQNGEQCELPNQQDPLEHRSANLEYERPRGYKENEEEVDFTAELPATVQSDPHNEETIHSETQNGETLTSEIQCEETLQSETQDEETLQSETQDEETRRSEENEGESGSRAELPINNYLPDDEKAKEIENSRKDQYFTDALQQLSSCIKNSKDIDKASEGEDSARETEPNEGTNLYNVSIAKELNLVESIHIHPMSFESRRSSLPCTGSRRSSVPCTGEMATNEDKIQNSVFQTLPSPKLYPDFEPSLAKLSYREMLICTPDGSFKGMPSSTPNIKGKRVSFLLKEETCLRDSKENNVDSNGTSTRRKSSLRSHKGNNDLTKENSVHLRKRRVSFKVNSREMNSLNQLNVKNSGKLEQSMGNQSSNYYSSVSLESLVYMEPSGSKTSDSESVYIDIHPSRGKSTSSSNTDSFSSYKKKAIVEVGLSKSQANSTSFKTSDSCAGDTKICEYEEIKLCNENNLHIEEGHGNLGNICVEEKTIENTNNEDEFSSSENETEGEEEESAVEEEESALEEEETDVEEEEPDVEEEESNVEEEELNVEEEEEEEEESEEKRPDTTAKEQLESEQESVEQNLIAEDQETERHSSDGSGHAEFVVNNYFLSCEQDENLNPGSGVKMAGEFKLPYKKKMRTSSLFKEKLLEVPNKSHLKDILNNIPISEFKKRNRRKLSEHCISKEQMQQYEIEEELMKNQKKKTQNQPHLTCFGSCKLKRPKKWVSPKLYDFLINKLKPQYGLRSRVRAEELVLFLVEHVECIKKKKDLMREDVEEIKIELARLCIIKTHWDFFKFINQYFEYNFKEKLYPSLPGVGRSAFEFGPTNVMENILESVQQ